MAEHWLVAMPVAAVLFFAARFRWWLSIPLALIPFGLLVSTWQLMRDDFVGRGLWQEQGWPYFASLWASSLFALSRAGHWNLRKKGQENFVEIARTTAERPLQRT